MVKYEIIRDQQQIFIKERLNNANDFISDITNINREILGCFISGSVARGDYWPGNKGGAIDLILFVIDSNKFNATKILGKDLESHIPGHFIKIKDHYFQIKIYDNSYIDHFKEQTESEKYAFLESILIFDRLDQYQNRIQSLKERITTNEIKGKLDSATGYANYLINPYKVDRWKRRDAIIQLNQNLDTAINSVVKGLFYLNYKYAPAEDRALYYSYSLHTLPKNYAQIMDQLLLKRENTMKDYKNREILFREQLLDFLINSKK